MKVIGLVVEDYAGKRKAIAFDEYKALLDEEEKVMDNFFHNSKDKQKLLEKCSKDEEFGLIMGELAASGYKLRATDKIYLAQRIGNDRYAIIGSKNNDAWDKEIYKNGMTYFTPGVDYICQFTGAKTKNFFVTLYLKFDNKQANVKIKAWGINEHNMLSLTFTGLRQFHVYACKVYKNRVGLLAGDNDKKYFMELRITNEGMVLAQQHEVCTMSVAKSIIVKNGEFELTC